jgi:flagellar hook-length control protein FliK
MENTALDPISPVKQGPAGDSPGFSSALDDAMARPGQRDGVNAGRQESAESGKAVPSEAQSRPEKTTRSPAKDDAQEQVPEPETADAKQPPESTPPVAMKTGRDATPPEVTESGPDTLVPAAAEAGLDKVPVTTVATGPSGGGQLPAGVAAGSASGNAETMQAVALTPRQPAGVPQQAGPIPSMPGQAQAGAAPADSQAGQLPQGTVDGLELSAPAASSASNRVDVTLLVALWRRSVGPQADASQPAARIDPAQVAVPVTATAAHASGASTGLPTLAVDTPLSGANWQQAMGERIQWLVGQRLQGAEIRLNPAHLGPMEVKVQFHNDQANIQFLSSHQVVRDALEAALPRLRDMLNDQGVELLNVDISDRSTTGHREDAGDGSRQAAGAASPQPADEDPVPDDTRRWSTPLIDANGVDLFV